MKKGSNDSQQFCQDLNCIQFACVSRIDIYFTTTAQSQFFFWKQFLMFQVFYSWFQNAPEVLELNTWFYNMIIGTQDQDLFYQLWNDSIVSILAIISP